MKCEHDEIHAFSYMRLKFATILLVFFPIQLSEEQFDLQHVHLNLNQTVTIIKHQGQW